MIESPETNRRWMSGRLGTGLALALAAAGPALAAELGDLDGDGRVTLGDVVHLREGRPPAPGSLQTDWPCFDGSTAWHFPGALYYESLRRSTASPVPNWSPGWPQIAVQSALPVDDSVSVTIDAATSGGGDSDTASIELTLHAAEDLENLEGFAIVDFAIVLETDGDVLVPLVHPRGDAPPWSSSDWYSEFPMSRLRHTAGDLTVHVLPQAALITGGKLVVSHTRGALFNEPIPAGDHKLRLEARLPRGTPAGSHPMRVHPGTQVVLANGRAVTPGTLGTGTLEVGGQVRAGWSSAVPRLLGDMDTRQIDGKVEFRVLPAEGHPGDTVKVKLQLRTETPLNSIYAHLQWPRNTLLCAGMESLAGRPESEEPALFVTERIVCSAGWALAPPDAELWVALSGAAIGAESDVGLPLEHFLPLAEWIDLAEIGFTIPPNLAGGAVVPITLRRVEKPEDEFPGSTGLSVPRAMFSPFERDVPCPPYWDQIDSNWEYDISYEHGFVKVLGEDPGEPLPAEELGIAFVLGDVTARPGQLVEVPVHASSEDRLTSLRLALESDPDLTVEAMEVEYIDNRDGSIFRRTVARGEYFVHQRCDDPGAPDARCTFATPFLAVLEPGVEPHQTLADFLLKGIDSGGEDWLTPDLREVAVLHVRVAEDAQPRTTQLRPAKFIWSREQAEVESGGFVSLFGYSFGPALSVEGGFITIDDSVSFLRGDCNADGEFAGQVADAVFLLSYNFLGGRPPPCLAACDANGDGTATGTVADAVYMLQFNFLGGSPPRAPFPECGPGDELDRRLGCEEPQCP